MFDRNRAQLDSSRRNVVPANRLEVSLPMLPRWVFTVWVAWLGAIGLAAALTASRIWNPNPILPVGVSVLMFAAGLGLVIAATVRLICGPRRIRALAGLLVGTAPFWFVAGHILMAIRPAFDRHVPPRWPSRVLEPLARPLVDLGARWFYPDRTAGTWVTMVGEKAEDAPSPGGRDGPAHRSLAGTARPIRDLADRLVSGAALRPAELRHHDMAIGSRVEHYQRGSDRMTDQDRHEVAHCVLTGTETARSDPPRVLIEGWAQANQGTPAEELADTAWNDRAKG